MAADSQAVRVHNSPLRAAGAHRGTALHPIRPTINSWDPWASGDSMQAAEGAHREQALDPSASNAFFAWGPWGEAVAGGSLPRAA